MENKPLISVIVPVYNVQKYVRKSVESILQQTYKNLEIILVDDGSTDESGKICDMLARSDNRVTVIHKKNGGLSDARNAGLDRATGELIGFVDSDDYIKEQEIVISGMAKGIDACAGTVCVNSGSYTVAIVGNGLDICYPAEHERLMERIRETGLLLSEYPPGTEPSNYTFPQRNRLIASWSDRLIVIAAGRGSGAMITANCAAKYGRKVRFY